MTSNLGARDNENNNIGFGTELERTGSEDKALKDFFRPELRNRIDAIVKFKKLDLLAIKKIVVKFIDELKGSLTSKHIKLNIAESVIEYLANQGYDPKMGARPLSRKIDQLIRVPLSKKILFDQLRDCTINIGMTDDQIEFITETHLLPGINSEGIICVDPVSNQD
jgi:ATP-dependent Clp protease ATP-binding subunit ClpA